MDIQNFGKDFISQYEAAREVLTLVRAVPGSVNPAPEDGVTLVYQDEGGGMAKEEVFDLLVLSVGIMPHSQNETWAKLLSIETGLDGFLPQETARGVFTAGTITGPMDIAQSASDGARAARLAAGYLGVKVC
jgi:heterodisulfide reductase subunit A